MYAHRKSTRHVSVHTIALAIVTIIVLLPVVWMLITSLKTNLEYLAYPMQFLPTVPQWGNYVDALITIPFWRYTRNSLILSFISSTLIVITSAMAGFAFARIQAPGRSSLFSIVIATLMVPPIILLIPQFVLFAQIGLTNTYWPWVLWGLAASPFFIFLFRQFFSAVPRDLEDAAEVDGCSTFRMFWQIFLPNAKPAMATVFILNFVSVWGDWLTPRIFLTDINTTLAVKLATAYVDPQGYPLTTINLAAAVIYTLVPLGLFFVGQRYITQGIITTGMK